MKPGIIYLTVEDPSDLRAMVEEAGDSLLEIVITGSPRTPLAGAVRSLGMQMVMTETPSVWGVRTPHRYYCRGKNAAAVLRVAHSLEND